MPAVEIKNETSFPLNIALSQVCPLHFQNGITQGDSLKTYCGSVWFTIEWKRDLETKKSRYSAAKSARAIALVSLATVGCVAVAGPMAVGAAAAAGSASAAALLASSPALIAAGSVEALAVSSVLATTTSKHAFKRVAKDNGVPKEDIEGTLKKVAMAETVLAATSIASMAKHGAAKAASSKFVKVAAAGAAKMIAKADSKVSEKHKDDKDKEKVEEGPDFEHGQTQRVFGVYIGFSTMRFVVREKRNGEGVLVTELWDEDKKALVT